MNAAPVPLNDALFAPQPGNPASRPASSLRGSRSSWEFLRICKVCDGSKPGFFVFGEHHAREWVTPLVSMEVAGRLVRNYGTDPETTAMVDNLDIFVLPTKNLDGSNYSLLQGGASQQRKNMARYCGTSPGQTSSTTLDDAEPPRRRTSAASTTTATTPSARSSTATRARTTNCTQRRSYAGPAEGSEPEIKNEHWLLDTYPNIKFSMNVHTSRRLLHVGAGARTRRVSRIALPYASKALPGALLGRPRTKVVEPDQAGPRHRRAGRPAPAR